VKRTLSLLLPLVLTGCFAPDPAISDEMPDDFPAGACRDTDTDACETGSSSSGTQGQVPADTCNSSEDCFGSGACVAAWDPEDGTRGPYTCQFMCVPLVDETTWCTDDAACCDAQARCTARGYCVL
jgi:hypothetical protein